jgi:protein-S-isoprenylcysteine O-methyltransferase Ste14
VGYGALVPDPAGMLAASRPRGGSTRGCSPQTNRWVVAAEPSAPESGYMAGLRSYLVSLTGLLLQLVGLFWVAAAAYFAITRPGTVRQKVRHFLQTFFPEPWAFVLIPVFVVVSLFVPPTFWIDLRFWNAALALVGAVCVVTSALFMCWARWSIGAMWAGRPLVQKAHELHTTGPYRIVRHPIYTGMVGMVFGAMLTIGFGQLVAIFIGTLGFVAWRVWAEERMLVATFGDRYRGYRRRVPALLPLPRGAS